MGRPFFGRAVNADTNGRRGVRKYLDSMKIIDSF